MEAPDKIYLQQNTTTDCYEEWWPEWFEARAKDTDIEYTRTDVFIDKACEWLKKNRKNYSPNALGEEYFIDDFKKAMEGEEVMKQEEKITINRTLAESICRYCEEHAIYGKLGRYDDFYYKIKRLLE